MNRTNAQQIAKGISAQYRQIISKLHRFTSGPFSTKEAIDILGLSNKKVRKLLPYLASHGWLKRVKRGVYFPIPLEAISPKDFREDAWIIGTKLFNPCYIGGFSAAQFLEMTEQHFRDTVIYTTKHVRKTKQNIHGVSYIIRSIKPERYFGTKIIWLRGQKIFVSDHTRTIVDILDNPAFGGGIRHVIEILSEYFGSNERNDKKLLDYIKRINNKAVFKRLGFLIENLKINAPDLLKTSLTNVNRGDAYLDPNLPHAGPKTEKWNLIINTSLDHSL